MKKLASSFQLPASRRYGRFLDFPGSSQLAARSSSRGFTLVETLVAVMLLSVAVVAPMSLASKSLGSAYYARDQITAFYLAQEAIEALRSIRDSQILIIAGNPSGAPDIFGLIPHLNEPFTVDGRKGDASTAIARCDGECPPLQTDGTLYGYPGVGDDANAWAPTHFTRTVHAYAIPGNADEIRITVTVTWQTGPIQERSFTISENMYRWVDDGVSQE